MNQPSHAARLESLLAERILVLDGAMGTMIQAEGLGEADYRGERFRDHPHSLMGAAESAVDESFEGGLLEYPHYTRPQEWEGRTIPEVLTSGHHKQIAEWRRGEAERLTKRRRPDLWAVLKKPGGEPLDKP